MKKSILFILIAKDAINSFFFKFLMCKPKKVMRGVILTQLVEDRADAVFEVSLRESAKLLLIERCGLGLPLMHSAIPKDYDRIRLAVIKLSGGTIEGLEKGIEEAHGDWRDVLLEAGFGHDEVAHLNWNPHIA